MKPCLEGSNVLTFCCNVNIYNCCACVFELQDKEVAGLKTSTSCVVLVVCTSVAEHDAQVSLVYTPMEEIHGWNSMLSFASVLLCFSHSISVLYILDCVGVNSYSSLAVP